METENDARRNKLDAGIDARGIEDQSPVPGCAECGAELRASGPGRRPVYYSRSCSSKAYRRRRVEDQQAAVAEALVSSRVEIPAGGEAGQGELLELAAAVQRSAARFLEHLERARRGEGDDLRCNQALTSLEAGLAGATGRIIRKAHVLRYEMTTALLAAERDADETAGEAPAGAPVSGPDESSRVETTPGSDGPAPSLNTSRVENVSGRGAAAPAPADPPLLLDSSRVETSRPALAMVDATPAAPGPASAPHRDTGEPRSPQNAAPVPAATRSSPVPAQQQAPAHEQTAPAPADPRHLRLALADDRTTTSPAARGLGH